MSVTPTSPQHNNVCKSSQRPPSNWALYVHEYLTTLLELAARGGRELLSLLSLLVVVVEVVVEVVRIIIIIIIIIQVYQ